MSIVSDRLLDRRIAVIGVAPGQIGGAIVDRLAAEGASIVIGGRDGEKLRRVAEGTAGAVRRVIPVDLAEPVSVVEFFRGAAEALDGLDGFVNNAAMYGSPGADGDVLDIELESFDELMDVNLRGQLLAVRAALPYLLSAGGGAIVLTSSIAGVLGEPTRVSYGIAKAGILAMARHVAARWGKQGVRCNAVVPGRILRDDIVPGGGDEVFNRHLLRKAASPRLGRPSDIAAAVSFLASDDAAFINGVHLMVDGGASAVFTPAPEEDEDFYPRHPFSRRDLGLDDVG